MTSSSPRSGEALQADVEAIGRIPILPSLLETVCRTTGMGFAAVARVTEDRWVACSVRDEARFGLAAGDELNAGATICNEIRQHQRPVVIDHVAEDPEFAQHHGLVRYGFQSYISFPIFRKDGRFFGTLCAIDIKPAKLKDPGMMGMFTLFADLIAFHLQAVEDLAQNEELLQEERRMAVLRERFIAMLGHDLRNPLTAVLNGSESLLTKVKGNEERDMLRMIVRSSRRMSGLVENLMDFARGRTGVALSVDREHDAPIGQALEQVLDEFRINWPDRVVETDLQLGGAVRADAGRVAQLFSNILGNALQHGHPEAPVQVKAAMHQGQFTLQVTNRGERIPAGSIERLFTPFYRGEHTAEKNGLGLGLFIASEIAHAHDGTLQVTSTDEATCVTFAMPV